MFGAQLLHDADAGVGDQHEAEQRVLKRPHHEDDGEHRSEDRVESSEHVGTHDLEGRARRRSGYVIDLSSRDTFGDLSRREASCRIDV